MPAGTVLEAQGENVGRRGGPGVVPWRISVTFAAGSMTQVLEPVDPEIAEHYTQKDVSDGCPTPLVQPFAGAGLGRAGAPIDPAPAGAGGALWGATYEAPFHTEWHEKSCMDSSSRKDRPCELWALRGSVARPARIMKGRAKSRPYLLALSQ